MALNGNAFTWNLKFDPLHKTQIFGSDLFQIHEVEWRLECCPNIWGSGHCCYLRCTKLPDWMKQIEVIFTIYIKGKYYMNQKKKKKLTIKHNFTANTSTASRVSVGSHQIQPLQIICQIQLSKLQKQIIQHKQEITSLKQQLLDTTSENKKQKQEIERYMSSLQKLRQNEILHKSQIESLQQKLEEKKAEKHHSINSITDKNEIILTDNIEGVNKGIDFKKYEQIFSKHQCIIDKWNGNKQTLQNITSQIKTSSSISISDDEKQIK
eukprot:50978_1